MQLNNQIRQVHLQKQRNLEVKQNGIWAIFHIGRNLNFPCLEIQAEYAYKVKQWFDNKIAVNVYLQKGWKQLYKLDKSQIYFQNNLLYIKQRKVENILRDGFSYILARNNATIQLLTKSLQNTYEVFPEIDQFINDKNVLQIPEHKVFDLEYWAYHGLNQSQIKAVQLVTRQRISFIKGPPGCGKTKTIARLATIFSYYKYPMLIGAVTNTANMTILYSILKQANQMNYIPNIVLFISKQLSTENILHPPQIRCHTFRQKLIINYMQLIQNKQIIRQSVEKQLDQFFNGQKMTKTFITVYYQAMTKTFNEADVVIITTTSAVKLDYKLEKDQKFKPFIGILDQASQASWADSYSFLNKGVQKMVFIGDDKQLTPTVVSQNQILKQTMFNKLFKKNKKYYVLLDVQYRMHPQISEFPNLYFYENQLKNGVTAQQRASPIPYFIKYPVSFINCQSSQIQQIDPRSGKKNYWNQGQIQIIKQMLSMFEIQDYKNIGIIAPYDLHIKIMTTHFSQQINYGLSVKTCDGYQGSERQYIIVSCVRSNKEGKIGFCNEENRLNVTLTRARRGIVLVGNKKTFLSEAEEPNVWHQYLKYLQKRQVIVQQQDFQKFLKKNNKIINGINMINHNQQKQLITKQNENSSQPKKQIKFKLKILQNDEDAQQQINKAYKQIKKNTKVLVKKIRNVKQKKMVEKNKMVQKQTIENQISWLKQNLKKIICQISQNQQKKRQIVLTKNYLSQYDKLISNFNNEQKEKTNNIQLKLQNSLQQLFQKIKFYSYQEFNHVQQNQIIKQCIDLKVFWMLMLQNQ